MNYIMHGTASEKEEILALYKSQLGREFCPWTESYPTEKEIDFDLSRDSLFVMKNKAGHIIATISIDLDANVEALPCWSPALQPGGELSRLAVSVDHQNQGIAREMLKYGMETLRNRGYLSVHFLVNKYNTKAIRSYAALQFQIVGECDLYDQPYLCYEKAL